MPAKLSVTVSLTIAPNSARVAVSGTLTAENVPAVIAVARRVAGFDGGFAILIDVSGLSSLDAEALQILQDSGFRVAAGLGQEVRRPRRPATAVLA